MSALKKKFLSEEELKDAAGVLRIRNKGAAEFLVGKATFERAFPDHKVLLKDAEVAGMRVSDGGHRGPKREVIKGRPGDRFYCFRRLEDG